MLIQIRVDEDEMSTVQAAAIAANARSLSDFCRPIILAACNDQKEKECLTQL